MSLNLSRNAVAMQRALGFLADAEGSLEDLSSCLARDVIVSEAQAAEHSRRIVDARNALNALRRQILCEHEEVCRHLRDAQMSFLQSKPLISMATGYTAGESNVERELDLSGLVYAPNESSAQSEGVEGQVLARTRHIAGSSSSRSRRMDVLSNAGNFEDGRGSVEVASSQTSALRDDECDTVKGLSDDGHSYAGTVVRGVLRGDSE